MVGKTHLCARVAAAFLAVCAETAVAETNVQPVLQMIADRGLAKLPAACTLCSCKITANAATGEKTSAGLSIKGDLAATANGLDVKAKVTAVYRVHQCKLEILSSEVNGEVRSGSLCGFLADRFDGVDFFRKELKPGRVINVAADDCAAVNAKLDEIFR